MLAFHASRTGRYARIKRKRDECSVMTVGWRRVRHRAFIYHRFYFRLHGTFRLAVTGRSKMSRVLWCVAASAPFCLGGCRMREDTGIIIYIEAEPNSRCALSSRLKVTNPAVSVTSHPTSSFSFRSQRRPRSYSEGRVMRGLLESKVGSREQLLLSSSSPGYKDAPRCIRERRCGLECLFAKDVYARVCRRTALK